MRVLETNRLILREISLEDAPFMLRLVNDPSFIKNIGDRGVRTLEDSGKYIERAALKSYERHGFGLYLVELKNDKTPIGISGLVKRDTLTDVDIGFAFFPEFCGKGYALESAIGVLDFAKNRLSLKRIVAVTSPENIPSIKLLEKLGLKFERLARLSEGAEETKIFALDF